MNANDNEQAFINKAKEAFDTSIESLDENTLSAITRCRQHALEKPSGKRAWVMLPAGALATLALVVALYFSVSSQNTNGLEADDLDMLSSSESLEFYEDLEFYQWLDENDLAS